MGVKGVYQRFAIFKLPEGTIYKRKLGDERLPREERTVTQTMNQDLKLYGKE